jgi:hypothetical protein
METRIYVVKDHAQKHRLVEASSAAQAISHVVRGQYNAEVATTKQVAAAMADGLQVERAGHAKQNTETTAHKAHN